MSRSTGMCESDDGQDDLMSRSTRMCGSDDGQDDLVQGFARVIGSDPQSSVCSARFADGSPPKLLIYFSFNVYMTDITE